MKTLMKLDIIKREADDRAHRMVMDEGWKYVAKNVWKSLVRDVGKNLKGESA